MTFATFIFGVVCIIAMAMGGPWLFSTVPSWSVYLPYMADMILLGISLVLGQIVANFNSFEVASNRFTFLSYGLAITIVHVVFLVSFSGYSFFYGILPDCFVDWMGSLNIATLRNILITSLCATSLNVTAVAVHVIIRQRRLACHG